MSTESIKAQLAEFGIHPSRALGQNFLADDAALDRIASVAVPGGLPVLEIGPGLGALTGALLSRGANVTAVELDRAMCEALSAIFRFNAYFTLVNADFLKFDIASFAENAGEFAVAGNLPYYITTPVCMKLMTDNGGTLPTRMTLMVQREAAQRFTASPRTKLYGPLSVLTSLYYDCRTLINLTPASYYPQPEVESTVVVLERKEGARPVEGLPRLLDDAFSMRRKTLVNNLRAKGFEREGAEALLLRCGIPTAARPEEVVPESYLRLTKEL